MVDSVHGNMVKATDGTTHSLTTVRPVDKDSQSTMIGLRLVGSEQVENKKRERLQKFADSLAEILASKSRGMSTGDASTALRAKVPGFKAALGRMTFTQFTKLFREFETQTGAAGGVSKIFLKT